MAIIVTAIRPFDYGHKRRVILHDTETNASYTLIYGDSVTERHIRFMAPYLVEREMKRKIRNWGKRNGNR